MKNRDNLIAERVRQVLNEKSLTQTQLGEYLGMSRSSISQYMNGLSSFQLSHIRAMAEFLHVSPYWLMGESEDKYEWYAYKVPKLEKDGTFNRQQILYSNSRHDFYTYSTQDIGRVKVGEIMLFDKDIEYEHNDIVAIMDEKEVVIGHLSIVGNTYVVSSSDNAVSRNKKYADILGRVTVFVGRVR